MGSRRMLALLDEGKSEGGDSMGMASLEVPAESDQTAELLGKLSGQRGSLPKGVPWSRVER